MSLGNIDSDTSYLDCRSLLVSPNYLLRTSRRYADFSLHERLFRIAMESCSEAMQCGEVQRTGDVRKAVCQVRQLETSNFRARERPENGLSPFSQGDGDSIFDLSALGVQRSTCDDGAQCHTHHIQILVLSNTPFSPLTMQLGLC